MQSRANKGQFQPEMWIMAHESMSRMNGYASDIKRLCDVDPLVKFKQDHELLKLTDLDNLKQDVIQAALRGNKAIKVFRLDQITMIQRLDALSLSLVM